jgi:2-polyprenyl-3-methyl-5-hydroxy-6-metoxy-1,4-benzoquinol methylase
MVSFNKRIKIALDHNGLDASTFSDAVKNAMKIVGEDELPSQRVLLCAAISFQQGKSHCDFGGGLSLYPLIMACLGMNVTVVDLYQASDSIAEKRMTKFKLHGVQLISEDLYQAVVPNNTFDGVSMFETIEHLPHSPKPVLEKMVASLKRGKRFILSVPNICRIENRFRMLSGRNPMGKYKAFFDSGERFLGHHREMIIEEVRWLPSQLGLETEEIFTTDLRYKEMRGNTVSAYLARLTDRHLVSDALLPQSWLRSIWLVARRPEQNMTVDQGRDQNPKRHSVEFQL